MQKVYRFSFLDQVSMGAVEDALALSILAVSSVRGESALILDGGYRLDPARRVAVLDATTDTGMALAQVFTSFCDHEFGLSSFSVERVQPR